MGWSSTTRATRVPQATRDAVWQRICGLAPQPGRQPAKPVCCYALQGQCTFGAGACEFSHDLASVSLVGCQFGLKCRLNHVAASELGPGDAIQDRSAPGSLDDGIMDSARSQGGSLSYVECRGPSCDSGDPLWEQLAGALQGEGEDEDLGDGDLSIAARKRLEEAGQYRLVDEDMADEWICVPAKVLLEKLQSRQERALQSHRYWLGDDLRDARVLWAEILGTLRHLQAANTSDAASDWPAPQQQQQQQKPLWDGAALQSAADLTDAAVRRAVALQPQDGKPPDRSLRSALAAAQIAISGLQRAASDALGRRLAGMAYDPMESLDGMLDEEVRRKLVEVRRCLERCIFVLYAAEVAEPRCKEANGHGGSSLDRTASFVVGGGVEVMGLTSAAEQGLNGQEGQLERYDEARGLWQVRLVASGTRLLLDEAHITGLRRHTGPTSELRRGRSRSPRRPGDARSVLELTQEAARNGEHVLVHHVVAWYGSDAQKQTVPV